MCFSLMQTCLSTLIILYIGPPSPVKDLTITNNLDDRTVTFMWTYDNAVNTIPATSFTVTVTPVNGGNPITETVSIDNHSLTLPLSQLVSEASYHVSVVATNQLGESNVIKKTFTSPGILAKLFNPCYSYSHTTLHEFALLLSAVNVSLETYFMLLSCSMLRPVLSKNCTQYYIL